MTRKSDLMDEDTNLNDVNAHQEALNARDNKKSLGQFINEILMNIKCAWKMLFSQWWVFTSTFIIFPGAFFSGPAMYNFMEVIVPDEHKRFQWFTLIVILIFNSFDTVGRYIGGALKLPESTVIVIGLSRTIFLFTTTYMGLAHDGHPWFDNDILKVLNLVFFAVSNGFIST